MKKIGLFLMISCLIAFFAFGFRSVKADTANLVADSSFENALTSHYEDNHDDYQVSSLGHWTGWFNAYKDDTNGVEGSSCLGLSVCWPGLAGNVWCTAWQDITVEAGATYTLTFQAKQWGTTPHTGLHVQGRSLGESNSWDGDVFDKVFALGEEYAEYQITFNVAERTSFRLAFWTYTVANDETSGVAGVFVDDVVLMSALNSGNLLGNRASLENGAVGNDYINSKVFANWSTLDSTYVLWEPANAFNGNMVANMMYRVEDANVTPWPLLYTDLNVEKNSTYTLTFYAKNWRKDLYPDQNLIVGIRNVNGPAIWDQVESIVIVPGADYAKYQFTFSTGELEEVRLVLFCQAHNRNAEDAIGGGMHIEVESLVKMNNLIKDSSVALPLVSHYDDNHDDYQASSFGHWTTWWYSSKDPVGFDDASAIKLDYAWTDFVNVKDVWSTAWTDVELVPNTNYKLTFKANNYTAGVDPTEYFRGLFIQGRTLGEANSWAGDLFECILTQVAEGYHEYSIVFNSLNESSMRLAFFVLTADPEVTRHVGLVLLDNLYLEPTLEAPTVEQRDVVELEQGDVMVGVDYNPVASSRYGEVEIKYYADDNGEKGELLAEKPTAAGIYHVEATSKDAVNYLPDTKVVKYEIKKYEQLLEVVCPTITFGATLVASAYSNYDGAAFSFEYYVEEAGAPGAKLDQAPVNAGTYYVKALAAGNEQYLDGESELVKFQIRKAQNEWIVALSMANIMEGEAVAPSAEAKYGTVVFTFSTKENGEYTETIPTAAGKYYVKATVAASDNYQELTAVKGFMINANNQGGSGSFMSCSSGAALLIYALSAASMLFFILRKRH